MVSELVPLNTHSSDLYCRSPSYFNKKNIKHLGKTGKGKKVKEDSGENEDSNSDTKKPR